jgi:hypothetical protein
MKARTGNECKKVNCRNFVYYHNWVNNYLKHKERLNPCLNCKHHYPSQYEETRIKKAGGERQKEE